MNTQVSIDIDSLEHLPAKTLLRLVETVQRVKKNQALHHRTVQHFSALFRQLEEWDIEPSFELGYSGDINLNFSGDGNRFGEVWAELRRHGFRAPSNRPKKGDTAFGGTFRQEGFSCIYVNFTSSVCRRVQVGTKTVEQPIYETQCGEFPELEKLAETAPAIEHEPEEIPF